MWLLSLGLCVLAGKGLAIHSALTEPTPTDAAKRLIPQRFVILQKIIRVPMLLQLLQFYCSQATKPSQQWGGIICICHFCGRSEVSRALATGPSFIPPLYPCGCMVWSCFCSGGPQAENDCVMTEKQLLSLLHLKEVFMFEQELSYHAILAFFFFPLFSIKTRISSLFPSFLRNSVALSCLQLVAKPVMQSSWKLGHVSLLLLALHVLFSGVGTSAWLICSLPFWRETPNTFPTLRA